tara:strand:- start:729 stop:1538 length:810 start_codon:yes stop_codon:yes gene_type:complete
MIENKNQIFFSIIICCYNSQRYISETINSILNQSYKNYEIVVVNDGSSDDTEKIINQYKKRIKNFKYIYQKNKGFAHSRNVAINHAKGEWIVIIDHDDVCLKNRLEIHYDQIISNKNQSKLFFANTYHFNDEKIIKKHFDQFSLDNINLSKKYASNYLLTIGCFIDSESVVFKKNEAINIGGFNSKYKYLADYDFFIRMGEKYSLSFTTQLVSMWRVHNQQATIMMKNIYNKELINLYVNYLFNNNIFFYTKIKIFTLLIKSIIKNIFK